MPDFRSAPPGRPLPRLSAVAYDHPDARRLTDALHREQLATYGFADHPGETSAAQFDPSRGLFVIARLNDGVAVGCGGVRMLNAATAEVKRMYVAPAARGRGVGEHILTALEWHAAQGGRTAMQLETGRLNHNALALYRRCGYTPRPPYVAGRDPHVNRAMTKQLEVRAQTGRPHNQMTEEDYRSERGKPVVGGSWLVENEYWFCRGSPRFRKSTMITFHQGRVLKMVAGPQ